MKRLRYLAACIAYLLNYDTCNSVSYSVTISLFSFAPQILMSVLALAHISVITYAETPWGVTSAAVYWNLHWDRTI